MYNEILSIGPFTIHGYGLMIAIGVLTALFVGEHRAKKRNLSGDEIYNLTLVCAFFGFLGAKLMFCIVEWKDFIKDPWSILSSSGFVVYGGIILGVLAGLGWCRFRKLDFWEYFDIVMPSVAIAQGFGRIGCFLAGCCYGRETDSFIGITFTNSDYAPNGVKLIPTQLISATGMILIAFVLIRYAKNRKHSGTVGFLYLILYSIGRFGVEFLRNDYRGEVGIFSTSQFISLFMVVIGAVGFGYRLKKASVSTADEKVEEDETNTKEAKTKETGDEE